MSAPGGLEKLIATAGQPTERAHLRRSAASWTSTPLREAAAELDVSFV